MTALIPGLPVQVSGSMNAQNQVVADSVKFKGSDLKAAMDAQAGLQPTMQKVAANTAQIQQTEAQVAAQQAALKAQQAQLTAEQQKIAANKAAIAEDNKRFGELGQYNILGETTVYFGNGKTTVDPQYQTQLATLSQQAKGITAYIIQVQGYASAVGSAALNQKLSSERANAVTAILEQQGGIPLTNMLAPGAMGTSAQVDSDKSAEGQAENRRVRSGRTGSGRTPPRQRSNQIHLMMPIRCVILPEHLVKPYRRLLSHIRPLPRVPRIVRLRLPRHQPPVHRSHVIFLRDRQAPVECAPIPSGHILRADDRSPTAASALESAPQTPPATRSCGT